MDKANDHGDFVIDESDFLTLSPDESEAALRAVDSWEKFATDTNTVQHRIVIKRTKFEVFVCRLRNAFRTFLFKIRYMNR